MPTQVADAKAGDWLLIRNWNLNVRQVTKVTPQLFKLGDGSTPYPTQISKNDRKIVCHVPDRETAERMRDSIAGIDGEFNRRRKAANQECNDRINAAVEARDKAIEKLLAELVPA